MKQSTFFFYVYDQFHHVVAAAADDDDGFFCVSKWKLDLNADLNNYYEFIIFSEKK